MVQQVESPKERAWRKGRRFFYNHSVAALGAGQALDIVSRLPVKGGIIEGMNVKSDAESLTWQAFVGTVFDDQTGTQLTPTPRNSINAVPVTVEVFAEPTVSNAGQPINQVIDIIGRTGAGSNDFIDTDIIQNDFMAERNQQFMVRIINDTASPTKIALQIDWREAD